MGAAIAVHEVEGNAFFGLVLAVSGFLGLRV
jgi:hypothetical protein